MTAPIITKETFSDLSTWLFAPTDYSNEQLVRLKDEELSLPLFLLANRYWLIGMLTNQLKNADIWSALPEQVQSYLFEVESLYYERIKAIKIETEYVCRLLKANDIDVIVMKGAATLFNGVAEPISNRYMKDLDILVPESMQTQAYELLCNDGYAKDLTYFELNSHDAHHAPPIVKNNVCYVELHRWLLLKHLNKILPTDDVWHKSIALKISNDIEVKQLSPTHQVVLSIIHSEIQNGGYDLYHLDLHQLVNLCSIISYFDDQIDWVSVTNYFENSGQKIILDTTLYSVFKLFKIETPITNYHDNTVKRRFEKCLSTYIKRQGADTFFSVLMEQLVSYKKRNILLMYGGAGYLDYILGVCKHIKFQCLKVLSFRHLKPYLLRVIRRN